MKTTLTDEATREISARLSEANREFAARYPGESFRRQPVHTVYGGAHLFKSDTTPRLVDVDVRVHQPGQHDRVARLDDGAARGHLVEGGDGGDPAAAQVNRGRAARLWSDDALTPYAQVGRRHDEDLKHKSGLLATE